MKSALLVAVGLGASLIAAATFATKLAAQGAEVVLFDGKSLDHFDLVGESKWRIEDGAAVAEGKMPTPLNFIMSKQKFKNFVATLEFWASDDANSGLYFRCSDAQKYTDRTCYEVNIFDQRPDPTYGTGSIVHHAEVNPMPKAGGKWNTIELTAKDRQLTVVFNGQKTVEARSGMWVEGPIGVQHGQGTIKVRKLVVKPL